MTETNRYAEWKMKSKPDRNWSEVTVEELQAYLGIRMYMSVLVLPSYDMYWSKDSVFGNHFAGSVMTRNRFDKINQYFHVADTSRNPARGQPGHNKLAHVQPVLDELRKNCLQQYIPHCNSSVDEAMVAFRGRLGWRQYVPAKPTKYGMKVWVRADPENGYTNDFQVYTGRSASGLPEKGLGARVVIDLTRNITGVNHIINCDSFFSSPELFLSLQEDDIYARGTVKSNRKGMPGSQGFEDKALKNQGDQTVLAKDDLIAVKWRDKRIVTIISTADSPVDCTHVKRKKKDGSHLLVPCHSAIERYNNNMNGVDHADQLRNAYPTFRKSRKWWHYLFWFAVDLAVCNAYICMKESANHQLKTKKGKIMDRTLLDFKKKLSKLFIGSYRSTKRHSLENVDPAGNSHWPVEVSKEKRCRYCRISRNLKRTCRFVCSGCGKGLHPKCFEDYHKHVFSGGAP